MSLWKFDSYKTQTSTKMAETVSSDNSKPMAASNQESISTNGFALCSETNIGFSSGSATACNSKPMAASNHDLTSTNRFPPIPTTDHPFANVELKPPSSNGFGMEKSSATTTFSWGDASTLQNPFAGDTSTSLTANGKPPSQIIASTAGKNQKRTRDNDDFAGPCTKRALTR